MTSLLITNDFPPKIGGIQSYLWELWSRLDPGATTVLTTPHPEAAAWDAAAALRVERTGPGILKPTPRLARRVGAMAQEAGADVIFLDPMLPVGLIGPRLTAAPYVVVVHGAEVTIWGRFPLAGQLGRRVLRGAAGVVAAGEFAAGEATRVAGTALPTLVLPPGVDQQRFHPLSPDERREARTALGLPLDVPLVLGLSRLVPRKGFDVLLDAVGGLDDVHVVIGGTGRDRKRLTARAAALGNRAHFLGAVDGADLARLYGCVDVFAMPCRNRWGGLEAEGFGIVFLEAAACAIPAIAGRSGGSTEAVVHGETGFVVDPRDAIELRTVLARLLGDDALRTRLGVAARQRVEAQFGYDRLAGQLAPLAAGDLTVLRVAAGSERYD